jgi:heme/copper-type cytochrome/quinol oxidase subunit 4
MPEEIEVETDHLQETIEELHKEREEREQEAKETAWTRYISLTTAFLAVIAAVAALQAGSLANEALIAKNESILHQAQASDQWSYYQSAGIKSNTAKQTAAILTALPNHAPDAGKVWGAESTNYEQRKEKAMEDAKEYEKQRDDKAEEAKKMLEHHEIFALCVTCTQVAIALSAIAALTKRRAVWYVSMLAGAIGLVLFLNGYMKKVAPNSPEHVVATENKHPAQSEGRPPAGSSEGSRPTATPEGKQPASAP